MREIIWVHGGNSERAKFHPTTPDFVEQFYFDVPNDSPGSMRALSGAELPPGIGCFRRVTLVREDTGDMVFCYVSTGIHGTMVVGPTVHTTFPAGGVLYYGLRPGRYVGTVQQENPQGGLQALPLDFYIDLLRVAGKGTKPGPQS